MSTCVLGKRSRLVLSSGNGAAHSASGAGRQGMRLPAAPKPAVGR
jgi:hypothetical protein